MARGKIKLINANGNFLETIELDESLFLPSSEKIESFELASYPWVDTKADICYKWVTIGGIKTKVPYPCIWKKDCDKKLYLDVYYPSDVEGEIEDTLKKCALEAALYAIPFAAPQFIAGDYAGAVATAISKFTEKFPGCVGEELSGKVRIDFREEKECGDWVRV